MYWDTTQTWNGESVENNWVVLGHDMFHMNEIDKGIDDKTLVDGIERAEINACNFENLLRQEKGLPKRTDYGGKPLPKAE